MIVALCTGVIISILFYNTYLSFNIKSRYRRFRYSIEKSYDILESREDVKDNASIAVFVILCAFAIMCGIIMNDQRRVVEKVESHTHQIGFENGDTFISRYYVGMINPVSSILIGKVNDSSTLKSLTESEPYDVIFDYERLSQRDESTLMKSLTNDATILQNVESKDKSKNVEIEVKFDEDVEAIKDDLYDEDVDMYSLVDGDTRIIVKITKYKVTKTSSRTGHSIDLGHKYLVRYSLQQNP